MFNDGVSKHFSLQMYRQEVAGVSLFVQKLTEWERGKKKKKRTTTKQS